MYKEFIYARQTAPCVIVKFQLDNWSDKFDLDYQKFFKNTEYVCLSAHRKPFFPWLFSSIAQRISQSIIRIWPITSLLSYAIDKRSWILKKYLSNINSQPSLIIAHNPGSLYPAHKLSEKLGIPFHFDVEDFHPGEGISKSDYDPNSNPMATLMKRLLPYADRVTFASPLIMKESLKLCHSIKYPIVINNCFPHCEFHSPADLSSEAHEKGEASSKASSTTKLRLVWYSQNINHSRGLEPLIEAIQGLRGEVALTLIGQLHDGFAASWIEPNRSFIETLEPMPQKDLHRSLVKFDIGLALEPGKDFNNEIALSNKIWAYFQSGLFILATDTNAQQQFLQEHPKHGILTSPMPNKLRDTLVKLIEKKESICGEMIQRYEAAKPFSWEHESLKVLQ